ncbi:Domain of uncharacterised function (DUF2825) [Pseudomonas aeruginosa]|nr:Domain of uncharacterised function (DUF2825) [Pseudomonas aeruginosa]
MPAPSVIRAERSLHPQRREPGWLETPCPERGSCRTVGDPRLRQLAADTGDHATGRSAARFAPPWEIPRGGANRRSVDRFIPRLWGNIGPAWSPSMSIPAHPHARGEHQAASAAATIDDGSSPHPWGTRRFLRDQGGCRRFIPTPVGNTMTFAGSIMKNAVHPHTRGEHAVALAPSAADGRFIPTPVGNTAVARARAPGRAVHPHTRGEHICTEREWISPNGSSPHPWGTLPAECYRVTPKRFIPTPVGNTGGSTKPTARWTVHPHTRGEHHGQLGGTQRIAGSSPHPWGTPQLSIISPVCGSVHPHTRGEHGSITRSTGCSIGSSPHPWGTPLPYPIVLKKEKQQQNSTGPSGPRAAPGNEGRTHPTA